MVFKKHLYFCCLRLKFPISCSCLGQAALEDASLAQIAVEYPLELYPIQTKQSIFNKSNKITYISLFKEIHILLCNVLHNVICFFFIGFEGVGTVVLC
jgi:hypothetical protein